MKIQYIKSKDIYNIASIEQINDNVVQVTGDIPIQEYGFMLSEDDATFNVDFSHYRTIYRAVEGGVQFSDDGNVYTDGGEFKPPNLIPDEVHELNILTNEELTECVADLMYEVSCLQLGL